MDCATIRKQQWGTITLIRADNQPHLVKYERIYGQCRYVDPETKKRCSRWSYQTANICWQHLITDKHLLISKSSIPNAGLGLFAADWKNYRELKKNPETGLLYEKSSVVLFHINDEIGVFDAGEKMTTEQFIERYGNSNKNVAPYTVDGVGECVYDELCLRSPSSYANDPINLDETFNSQFKNFNTTRVTHSPDNAVAVADNSDELVRLYASRPIHHGQEILWNYGMQYWEADNMKLLYKNK